MVSLKAAILTLGLLWWLVQGQGADGGFLMSSWPLIFLSPALGSTFPQSHLLSLTVSSNTEFCLNPEHLGLGVNLQRPAP